MVKVKKLSFVSVLILLSFSVLNMGCGLLHHQVKPEIETSVNEADFPNLNIPYSISVIEVLQKTNNNIHLCGPHYVNLDDLTVTSAKHLREILKKKNVNINDHGEKQIILRISEVNCERHLLTNNFIHTLKLKINAGESIKKEYQSTRRIVDGWMTTWAIERIIEDLVYQILEDPAIVKYLQEKPGSVVIN